jgi:hypothetical protein
VASSLQLFRLKRIKTRKHCCTEYFYTLFTRLFVRTFGNSAECEQYIVQSVLQEFLRTSMSFPYSAALCWWNHGNGMEEYRLTVKQFIDLCAVLFVLLLVYISAITWKGREDGTTKAGAVSLRLGD